MRRNAERLGGGEPERELGSGDQVKLRRTGWHAYWQNHDRLEEEHESKFQLHRTDLGRTHGIHELS